MNIPNGIAFVGYLRRDEPLFLRHPGPYSRRPLAPCLPAGGPPQTQNPDKNSTRHLRRKYRNMTERFAGDLSLQSSRHACKIGVAASPVASLCDRSQFSTPSRVTQSPFKYRAAGHRDVPRKTLEGTLKSGKSGTGTFGAKRCAVTGLPTAF
jgi:hypothetical protein